MSPKKQEPTNREAFTLIIGQSRFRNNPTRPICNRSDADAPKPPTYPFNTSIFKEHRNTKDTKRTAHPKIGRICRHTSRISTAASPPLPFQQRASTPRRPGEALSRPRGKNPQEGKRRPSQFFRKGGIYYKILRLTLSMAQRMPPCSKIVAADAASQTVWILRAFGISRTASNASTTAA